MIGPVSTYPFSHVNVLASPTKVMVSRGPTGIAKGISGAPVHAISKQESIKGIY